MSEGRITRSQAKENVELQNEIEAFNPFVTHDRIAHSPSPASRAPAQSQTKITTKTSGTPPSLLDTSLPESTLQNLPLLDFPLPESIAKTSTQISFEIPALPKVQPSTVLNMANANDNIQIITLKDAVCLVPEFDGHNIPLSEFLDYCSEALALVGAASEANLTRYVRAKLTGEARRAVLDKTFNTIDEFKTFLKTIYGRTKTINQLNGELGSEYQRDNESVLSYANRMREIGQKILEARRLENGTVDTAFKRSNEINLIDCFKRGLKPEIEDKLPEVEGVIDIVTEAIKIERLLEEKKVLRGNQRRSGETRRSLLCQICREEGHEASHCRRQYRNNCTYCGRIGHNYDQCLKRNKIQSKCQLCDTTGHSANSCSTLPRCQMCNTIGHIAKTCLRLKQTPPTITCQICDKKGHTAKDCFHAIGNVNRPTDRTPLPTCEKCGRIGHVTSACYARQPLPTHSRPLIVCQYCKAANHTIAECRKRMAANAQNARAQPLLGNDNDLSQPSVSREIPKPQERSTNAIHTFDNLLGELIPSN